MVKKWIKEAIKKPGSLIGWIYRNLGEKGFTQRGTIKVSTLRDIIAGKRVGGVNPSKKTVSRARLALELRGFRKKKK